MGSHMATGLKDFFMGFRIEKVIRSFEMDVLVNNFLMKAEGCSDRLINLNFVVDKIVEKGLLNFSNAVATDLIAVIADDRKGLSQVLSISVSEDYSNLSNLPIITMKI
jgi:nucleotide-binding universal stress UspA family protein